MLTLSTAVIVALVLFIVLMVIGTPIWVALGLSGALIVISLDVPQMTIAQQFYISISKWELLAAPYFLLAGNFMAFGGPARAIFDFVKNLVGHLHGGVGAATVIACAIFGALTGSATAVVVAVGSMAIPSLLELGYDRKYCLGLVAGAGTLGQMIPPSIYMILYATLVQMDVATLFIAGIIPGVLITVALIIVAVIRSRRLEAEEGVSVVTKRASSKERWSSFLEALPALIMPVIVLGGIYSGIFTATEAAAIAAVYAFLVGRYYYKELEGESLRKAIIGAMTTTTIIFILLGAVTLFANGLTLVHLPQVIAEATVSSGLSYPLMLLMILIVWLVMGMFLDCIPILYLTMPIFWPAVQAMGGNPIHFCIVTIAAMMVAQVTPPFGMSLFAMAGLYKDSVETVISGVTPYFIVLLIMSIVLTYIPQLSLLFVH